MTRGVSPSPRTQRTEVHLHARLVSVAGGQDRVVPSRVHLEDRSDRRVHLGVHQDHVLAVPNASRIDLGAELHGAGDVDQRVDLVGAADEERVLGDRRLSGANAVLERRLRVATVLSSSPAYR